MHALPRGRCVVLCKVGRHLRTIREISNGISALFPAGMGWVNDVNAGAMASAFPAVEQKLSRREGSHWLDAAEETFDLPSDFGGQFVTTSATPGSFSAWDAARIRLALRFLQLRWLVWLFIGLGIDSCAGRSSRSVGLDACSSYRFRQRGCEELCSASHGLRWERGFSPRCRWALGGDGAPFCRWVRREKKKVAVRKYTSVSV